MGNCGDQVAADDASSGGPPVAGATDRSNTGRRAASQAPEKRRSGSERRRRAVRYRHAMPMRLWQEAGNDRVVGHHASLEGERGRAGPGDPGPLGTCPRWVPIAFLASQGAGEMVLKGRIDRWRWTEKCRPTVANANGHLRL